MKNKLFFLIILFIFPLLSHPQKVLELDSRRIDIDLKEYLIYFEDKTNKIKPEEIIAGKYDSLFKKSPKTGLNFGFTSSNIWIKFKLKNTNLPQSSGIAVNENQWYLESTYVLLDSLVLYHKNEKNQYERGFSGDRIPISKHTYPFNHFTFPILLKDNQINTFYLKVNTLGSNQIFLHLQNSYYFAQINFFVQLFYGLFFGSLCIMLIYNLFLYTAINSRIYLYYCGYILFYVISQLTYSGHGFYYIWGEYTEFANLIASLSVQTSMFLIILFSFNFLEIKENLSKVYRFYYWIIYFFIASLLLCFFVNYKVHALITAFLAFVSSVTLFVLGCIIWYRGKIYAKYFVVGWFVFLLGTLIFSVKSFGVLGEAVIFNHAHQVGSLIQVLFLSIALADQINTYRKEKQQAQNDTFIAIKENERILAEQNKMLEEKVLERTKELQQKQNEVLVQNEELIQQRDEILTQRDFIESQNHALIEKDKRIEGSINAAKTIQNAILPYKSKLDTLLKDYFVINKPRDIVSGDFFWLNQIENTNVLAVADCTGHGVQGAFMTVIGNTLLDKIVRVWDIINPKEILTRLHQEIEIVLKTEDETENNNGMDIGILTWKSIDAQTFEVCFASAKRPLYVIENNILREINGTRKSIGGTSQIQREFEVHQWTCAKNTEFIMFSDGFVDQNNIKRKKIGEQRLKELLLTNINLSMANKKVILENELNQHMTNTIQRDDILMVGFRIS